MQPPKVQTRKRVFLWWTAAITGLAISAAVLFLFNPAEHAFYPRCLLYSTTGLLCPGCGGLRAAHQLLHGNVAAAWSLNPIVVLLSPVALWLVFSALLAMWRGRAFAIPDVKIAAIIAFSVALLIFGVLRNLPAL